MLCYSGGADRDRNDDRRSAIQMVRLLCVSVNYLILKYICMPSLSIIHVS